MVIFIMISKHTAEDCAIHNEKMRRTWNQIYARMPELMKKHGIKSLGSWAVMPEHTVYLMFEAPSGEAWQKYLMEPDTMTWLGTNTTEIKMATNLADTTTTLQR